MVKNKCSVFWARGSGLAELICGMALMGIILLLVLRLVMGWGQGWTRALKHINVQQNLRMSCEGVVKEYRYSAGSIVYPAIGQTGEYLEFRDCFNSRTYKFYVAIPIDYKEVPVLYRYVKDDSAVSPGINQLTEPSEVAIRELKFIRVSTNGVRMSVMIEDRRTGIEIKMETMMSCLNRVM